MLYFLNDTVYCRRENGHEQMQLEIFEAALSGNEAVFRERALAWLERDIAFDGLLWATGTPRTWHDVRVFGRPAEMARKYLAIAPLDPVCGRAEAAPERTHVVIAADLCLPRSAALEFWQGYGGHQLLLYSKADGSGRAVAWLSVLRSDDTPFSAGEQLVMHHVAQAVLTAQQVCRAKATHTQAMPPAPPAPAVPLTGRELAVAHAYADGRPVKEVARLMGLSTSTVQCHLARIYRKLGVHSKIALRKVLQDRRSRPRYC